MKLSSSVTRFHASRIAPCPCECHDEWVHGFTLRDGEREGMYLAARREQSGVRWLDIAISAGFGFGCVALRAWVDLETRTIKSRILAPKEVDGHPALALGGWLNRVEVTALQMDVATLTTQLVLGDDRLVAHLCDTPNAHAPTAVAPPAKRKTPAATLTRTRRVPEEALEKELAKAMKAVDPSSFSSAKPARR